MIEINGTMSNQELIEFDTAIRKCLRVCVSSMLQSIGFEAANETALGTLCEMLQSCKLFIIIHFAYNIIL